MTIVAIKDGKLAIDRCVTSTRDGRLVSRKPQTKLLEFAKDSGLTIRGEPLLRAFIAGSLSNSQSIMTAIHSEKTAKTLEEFLELHRLYSVTYAGMYWVVPSAQRPGVWWIVNWNTGAIQELKPNGSRVIRPTDAAVPELEKWLDTPEEIVWFYNKLSKSCGFGMNTYNPWTGVLEQIDEPTPEVAEKIRQTLIRSIDIWFLKEPEPNTELSKGDKGLIK